MQSSVYFDTLRGVNYSTTAEEKNCYQKASKLKCTPAPSGDIVGLSPDCVLPRWMWEPDSRNVIRNPPSINIISCCVTCCVPAQLTRLLKPLSEYTQFLEVSLSLGDDRFYRSDPTTRITIILSRLMALPLPPVFISTLASVIQKY